MPKRPVKAEDVVLTATAARILGVSSETIRGWANTGRLHATKTSGGLRLFSRSECERLRRTRNSQQDAAVVEPMA